jgi:hypothetical protein
MRVFPRYKFVFMSHAPHEILIDALTRFRSEFIYESHECHLVRDFFFFKNMRSIHKCSLSLTHCESRRKVWASRPRILLHHVISERRRVTSSSLQQFAFFEIHFWWDSHACVTLAIVKLWNGASSRLNCGHDKRRAPSTCQTMRVV